MTQSNFRFSDPVLTKMLFDINKDFKPSKDSSKMSIPFRSEVIVGEKHENKAVIELIIHISQDSNDFPYYMIAGMSAVFMWDKSCDPKLADTLLNRNAPALLLGYLRPYVAQITAASPFNTIHIPFMNFLEDDDQSEQA